MATPLWFRSVRAEWVRATPYHGTDPGPYSLYGAECVGVRGKGTKGCEILYILCDRPDGVGEFTEDRLYRGSQVRLSKPHQRSADEDQHTKTTLLWWQRYAENEPKSHWAVNFPLGKPAPQVVDAPKLSMLTKVLRFFGVAK
jgi:hypothetical protein